MSGDPEKTTSASFRMIVVCSMVVLYSMQSLLITASKSGNKEYAYDPNSVVLMTELCKAFIAGGLLAQARADSKETTQITVDMNCFKYAIPALLYAVHNNLVFLGLYYLNAPTYQLLNNIKIIVTGLLYRSFLKKPLRIVQWIGLSLLMLGQMVATIKTSAASESAAMDSANFTTGVITMLVLACMSGMAGVYNESLLKGSSDSTHWQNLQLYCFSVLFCGIQFMFQNSGSATSKGFFDGFEGLTWAVILTSATMGQCISMVLKYTNNITNRFATAASMFFTTFGSYMMFGTVVEMPFFLGLGLIALAFGLYFVDVDKLSLLDEELLCDKGKSSPRCAPSSP